MPKRKPPLTELNLPLRKRFYIHFKFELFAFKIWGGGGCCFFYLRREATKPVEMRFLLMNVYRVFCNVLNKVDK